MSFDKTSNPEYSKFIALSRYAKWLPDDKRREEWHETVGRYASFFGDRVGKLPKGHQVDFKLAVDAVGELDVMPSMRTLMTAGKALERDNVAGYNCAYTPIDTLRSFDEIMYILMCGTGVGFSVERQYVNKLPEVAEEFYPTDTVIVVPDSKIGWASSLKQLLSLLYAGNVPKWDLSKLRPAGAPLKTFGGRSSGPAPLDTLFRFCVNTISNANGRKLTSIECHDIVCKIGEIVVVGGVRRSACISLSNLTDERMRKCKSGEWWNGNAQRALANNSVCYTERPDMGIFMREWQSLYDSKSGERGIFNRVASHKQAARNGRREVEGIEFGTNPCSEIILRPKQFCNLSEVVVRADDTLESLKEKVKQATILGTLQSTLTDFRYLSSAWQKNTEEERLLGVSFTGIYDHVIMNGNCDTYCIEETHDWLKALKNVAVETNAKWAVLLGIPQSTAITCVKPSGTVSQLVDSASGIHPRYAPYYIRTVRADKKDPLAMLMRDGGFIVEDEFNSPTSTDVFSFPMKSMGNVFRDDRTAIEQLELWLVYQRHWCEHKPSITVYVRENEWLEVGAWVYKHFDEVSGISFLPHTDHSYQQAPYQEIDEDEYNKLVAQMPVDVDWSKLSDYEEVDNTTSSQELACTGSVCEIVDIEQ